MNAEKGLLILFLDASISFQLFSKLKKKYNKLERKINQLEVERGVKNRVQVLTQNLRNSYKSLKRAERNYDFNGAWSFQPEIEDSRQKILEMGINIDEMQKISKVCEEWAELQFQLEEKLEAKQEIPPFHRINQ